MADTAALYALTGAVGGAVLATGGAVLGPLLLHRRQAAERQEAHQRQEERERAQQSREDDLRQRQQQFELQVVERDRQAEAERERAADIRARQSATTQRLLRMRATTRAWHLLLLDTHRDLRRGQPVNPEAFSVAWHAARDDVNDAFDDALHHGLWIAHARPARLLAGDGRALPHRRSDQAIDMTTLGEALIDATDAVTECVEAGCPLPENRAAEARSALTQLEVARESLAAYIVGRLAALGVEMERGLEGPTPRS
ncbi:hypothetical protein [Streptomyces erythrochromogenes]|uniref:hypothetical protein n=1 Tax=Streptomyces erythrochromogenes TaxID=285574 RepID=UPI0036839AB2